MPNSHARGDQRGRLGARLEERGGRDQRDRTERRGGHQLPEAVDQRAEGVGVHVPQREHHAHDGGSSQISQPSSMPASAADAPTSAATLASTSAVRSTPSRKTFQPRPSKSAWRMPCAVTGAGKEATRPLLPGGRVRLRSVCVLSLCHRYSVRSAAGTGPLGLSAQAGPGDRVRRRIPKPAATSTPPATASIARSSPVKGRLPPLSVATGVADRPARRCRPAPGSAPCCRCIRPGTTVRRPTWQSQGQNGRRENRDDALHCVLLVVRRTDSGMPSSPSAVGPSAGRESCPPANPVLGGESW